MYAFADFFYRHNHQGHQNGKAKDHSPMHTCKQQDEEDICDIPA